MRLGKFRFLLDGLVEAGECFLALRSSACKIMTSAPATAACESPYIEG
jgi:hypothetical protein